MNMKEKKTTPTQTQLGKWYWIPAILGIYSCTGQLPDSFRFEQQEEVFGTIQDVDTKIDLLWVVDNSPSMDSAQEKLRQNLGGFGQKYLKPGWDIRIGVITTDTYMANDAFTAYLARTVPGSVGYNSAHVTAKVNAGTFTNPSWNSNLVNLTTGDFDNGFTYNDIVPAWGPNYAKLLPGIHDGPITGFCFNAMPLFLNGNAQCSIRDDQSGNTGTANCLNPNAGSGEDAITQCVNTIQNDSVHSGKAMIETKPPAGTPGDAAWTQQLIDDFIINATTGSAGQGSERGFASVQQFLSDNERTATPFFRAGALHGIIFLSDEDDGSLEIPDPVPADFSPQTGHMCDESSLVALNPGHNINGAGGYCCSNPANGCKFGSLGTSCPSKTVDGLTYTLSLCPVSGDLVPVSDMKDQLDSFFLNLEGSGATDPNYFVVAITPLTAQTIQDLQADRDAVDTSLGLRLSVAVDRGDRYMALANSVGNGSLTMDIGESDYSGILDQIGQTIIAKKGTFDLNFPATNKSEMIVVILHADGTQTVVQDNQYSLQGNQITITDIDFLLTLQSTDKVLINYQPSEV